MSKKKEFTLDLNKLFKKRRGELVIDLNKLWGDNFKLFLAALVFVLIVGVVLFSYAYFGFQRFAEERSALCKSLTPELNQYFANNSTVDQCDCYFEPNKTGVQELDQRTEPLCTCDCLTKNGTSFKVAIRAQK